MKRIVLLFSTVLFVVAGFAQKQPSDSTTQKANNLKMATLPAKPAPKKKRDWSKINLSNRANDHLLIQLGYAGWAQVPDTISLKGFSRSFNVYLMYDFPFKTDPRFSVAVGVGIGSDNIFFNKQSVGVNSLDATIPFPNSANNNTNYFKKFKLVTTYAEIPVELRFAADPEHIDNSWKGAVGIKIGALLDAHTKGKDLVNSTGGVVNDYIEKEASKRYFNSTKLSGTGRIGMGHISLFGEIQINNFIKTGLGPNVIPFTIGLTFSGL
jgi:hypothetical protein